MNENESISTAADGAGAAPPAFKHDAFACHAGVARQDVTPPAGIYCRNWGAATHDVADSLHRPLSVTALVLQASPEDMPLVYIDADLGWWRSFKEGEEFCHQLYKQLGLDAAHLIFGLSHTHAAPPLMVSPDPEWTGGELLTPYVHEVFAAVVCAVEQARAEIQPATVTWHTGRCALATNRDLRDPAAERLVCGFNPGVAADDTLVVGRVTDADDKIIAAVANYACHPTTLAWDNRAVSPDFLGAMRETVEANTDGALALFMQGASGDLSPRYQYVADTAVADAHGRQLGFAVLATLADMEPPRQRLVFSGVQESGAPLAVWTREADPDVSALQEAARYHVTLELKDLPPADELERQRAACEDRTMAERLRRARDIRIAFGDAAEYDLPFWVWRLGDAWLVGTMCECYSWIQQALRAEFAPRTILFLNLMNGSVGYLPPADLYATDVYQVWQTPFARHGLENLYEALAEEIRAGLAT